jgi:hypothetical protein
MQAIAGSGEIMKKSEEHIAIACPDGGSHKSLKSSEK